MNYKWLVLFLLFTASCGTAQDKPNIIFILGDDLGYGDVGCYGQQHIRTPNIDALARQGMRFTQAYSGSTVCAPSRGVLMTGLHTGHALVRNNGITKDGIRVNLPASTVTVADILKKNGYATGIFGKWGLGEEGSDGIPTKQGFDEFFGYLSQGRAHKYYVDYLWHNEKKIFFPENEGGRKGVNSAEWYFDALKNFVKEKSKQPFFVYYATTLPHSELTAPDSDIRQYLGPDGKSIFKEHSHRPKNDLAATDIPNATYAAMVSQLDRHVGEIVKLVQSLGIDKNTLIIFSSDNGPAAAKAGYNPDVFHGADKLRGIKRDLYEGGIRVPFIARWTGKIKPGSESDYPFAFWDFLPTVTDLIGVATPAGLDGVSALPVFYGRKMERKDPLYWEFISPVGSFRMAVRQGKWKGVVHGLENPMQLFDLEKDPQEKVNLASQHPDKVRELKEIIRGARTQSAHWPADDRLMNEFLK